MSIPIFLRAERCSGFDGLPALWTDRAAARRNFHTPARQHSHLRARSPEANHRGSLRVFLFGQQFLCEYNNPVAVFIIAKTDLTNTEEWVNRRVDAHHFFHIIA